MSERRLGARPTIALVLLVGLLLAYGLEWGPRPTDGSERRTVLVDLPETETADRARAAVSAALAELRAAEPVSLDDLVAESLVAAREAAGAIRGDVARMVASIGAMQPNDLQIEWDPQPIPSEEVLRGPEQETSFGRRRDDAPGRPSGGRTVHLRVRLSELVEEGPRGPGVAVHVLWTSGEAGAFLAAGAFADRLAEHIDARLARVVEEGAR